MQSIRELYKTGAGPSSSHTIGPTRACKEAVIENKEANYFVIKLYGSLALTGRGHGTDEACINAIDCFPVKVIFDMNEKEIEHPNTMDILAYKNDKLLTTTRYYSIGGGSILKKGQKPSKFIYPHKTFDEIKKYCQGKKISLAQYVYEIEGDSIQDFLWNIWIECKTTIEKGLLLEGQIRSNAKYLRTAKSVFQKVIPNEDECLRKVRLLTSYALSTSEENASGGVVLTAPTCGACGILPAVVQYLKTSRNISRQQTIDALAVASVFGNLTKTYSSISGAEAGCQAEVGTACSMAAAAASYCLYPNASIDEIENAAMIAMQHNLGLTCDPIDGYVIIPCIQRNAIAAIKAVDSANIAHLSWNTSPYISFDKIIAIMKKTGDDMRDEYKETSMGGLAKFVPDILKKQN